ncbi:unnamed protein product [Thelazia callipaeda]|uniref:RING-type domain-containing protein n=1 Tax=Thelazia callipaeda TaxID=103827 RepID=A0A0N5CQY1_THECL|nr:unnamed protein product [Thelazia callipaeda]
MARRQNIYAVHMDCVGIETANIKPSILYSRQNLVQAYKRMGTAPFDCDKNMTCVMNLRATGAGEFHSVEYEPSHAKGSIYLGARNGYIFAYRVNNEQEKFSQILFTLDLVREVNVNGLIKKPEEELHLFSINGKESILVICGPVTYYRLYNTDPGDSIKIIDIVRSEMFVVSGLEKKCRKVDYEAKKSRLIFFMDGSIAYELKLTINHDGQLKKFDDPKLNKFDNFRGIQEPYEYIESLWPLHLRNGRSLFYNPEYLNLFRQQTTKFPMSYYGILDCTFFVVMRVEDLTKIVPNNTGCDTSYSMRVMLYDSYATIIRTKNFKDIEAVRIKVAIYYRQVFTAMKEKKSLIYQRNIVNSEFDASNQFIIAPNTYGGIYVLDDYIYYQDKPSKDCLLYYKRRKITLSKKKLIEDYVMRASSIAQRPIISDSCTFTIRSSHYDETIKTVLYVLQQGPEIHLATTNVKYFESLKILKKQSALLSTNASIFTLYPYVLYRILVFVNQSFSHLALYTGRILYAEAGVERVMDSEIDAVEDLVQESTIATKAMPKKDFEKIVYGVESEIIARPETHVNLCKIIEA